MNMYLITNMHLGFHEIYFVEKESKIILTKAMVPLKSNIALIYYFFCSTHEVRHFSLTIFSLESILYTHEQLLERLVLRYLVGHLAMDGWILVSLI